MSNPATMMCQTEWIYDFGLFKMRIFDCHKDSARYYTIDDMPYMILRSYEDFDNLNREILESLGMSHLYPDIKAKRIIMKNNALWDHIWFYPNPVVTTPTGPGQEGR